MKFPDWLNVYGDLSFRGKCPSEEAEQVTFFNWIRSEYPDTYGRLALHVRNEGKRTQLETLRQKASGLTVGAPDIIVLPGFVCELKRKDHTKCKWQDGQIEYLETAQKVGSFVCVALGHEAAIKSFYDYFIKSVDINN